MECAFLKAETLRKKGGPNFMLMATRLAVWKMSLGGGLLLKVPSTRAVVAHTQVPALASAYRDVTKYSENTG